MQAGPDLSTIGALIGDPARAVMLSALLAGPPLPASELAARAHITPQTASAHLARLVEGGLVTMTQRGRHRYYALKNADVAHALEALAVIAPASLNPVRRQPDAQTALRHARTCYDHLAGRLGVAVSEALLERGLLEADGESYRLTEAGSDWLANWEIDEAALRRNRRLFARACLDWSERRPHLAGALGAAVASRFFDQGWIERIPGDRAVRLTDTGRDGICRELGIDPRLLA